MPKLWDKPVYRLKTKTNKQVLIDVTTSVRTGLPPNKRVAEMATFFENKGVQKVVDFGAGALRHCFPLLDAGFQVFAVEFEEQFKKHACKEALERASEYPNFTTLVWPRDFKRYRGAFDAALLCFVLQTMPVPKERETVLRLLYKKMTDGSYLVYMSRFGQNRALTKTRSRKVEDGFYMDPKRKHHSFYTEFKTSDTHETFERFGFERLRDLSERGNEQVYLYGKGSATWI